MLTAETKNETIATTTSLVPGRGYWVYLPSGGAWTIVGQLVTNKNVSIAAGWQMIGAFDKEIDVAVLKLAYSTIQSVFGYDSEGYYHAKDMKPGKGYWANFGAAVTIVSTS